MAMGETGLLTKFGIFVGLIVFFGIVSVIFVRWLFHYYNFLETNHELAKESLSEKIILLWRYNAIASLGATGIAILYGPFLSGFGIDVTIESVVAAALLFAVINFTVRIASYAYLNSNPDRSKEYMIRLKEDAHNAVYSLVLGLWFLLFLGVGMNVVNGSVLHSYSLPSVDPVLSMVYAIAIVITPGLLATISEVTCWRGPLTVPDELTD